MFWSLLQNVGGKSIMFIVMIILARLLTPEIFGLIGMLMIFVQVSQALVVGGFNQALIQKKDTDEEDYSSVFWINLSVSILIYGILFFAAPLIANFYDQPTLIELTRVLSLVFVINAFSYVQEARLSKKMQFKTLTLVNIPSTIIGGGVGVSMAVMGFGVWSIIALQLATRLAYAVQIWIYSRWQPLWAFNIARIKALFSFGSKLMISGVINTIYQNIYLVVIGKFFPLSSVGYYQQASNMVQTPATTFSGALNKVTFSAFSTIQNDNKKLKEGFRKIIQQVLFWLCPTFVLAGVLAEPLFRFVFTEKWLPAVPYFQWLCTVGVFLPLHLYNLNIVNVKGRSDLFLKLEIFKKTIVTIGIIIAVPLGIQALVIFQAITSVLLYLANGYFSGRFIQYSIPEQIKDIAPIIGLSIVVGIIILIWDRHASSFPDLIRIIIGFGIGGGLYWFAARFLKFAPYLEFKFIFQTRLLNRFTK